MFRKAMQDRGKVGSQQIDELASKDAGQDPLSRIYRDISRDKDVAASQMLHYLDDGNSAEKAVQTARQLIFLKGTDSHDYKFSSAVLEDYYAISPQWRNHFLAASVYKLRGSDDKDNGLVERIRGALT